MTGDKPKPLREGIDFYVNPEGKFVLTDHFLRRRGFCCGNGCFHCPYGRVKGATTPVAPPPPKREAKP